MDFSHYNAAEREHIVKLLEQKQMRDFMKFYSSLVDRCFNDCINDFTSKTLTTKEETCIQRCTDKFLKHNERVGQRFAEYNQGVAAQAQSAQSGSGGWFGGGR